MHYFETKVIDELEKATKDLVISIEKETRIISFAAYAYAYKMVAIGGMIVLAAVFDHPILRFTVPISLMVLIAVVDSLLSAMKFHVWKERHAKEKVYFEKSKAVTDYGSERLLQFLATTDPLNEAGAAETRVIN